MAGGAGCAGDATDGPEAEDSAGVPPETVTETGGAGVTGGTGSSRSAGNWLPPVSFGASILAESALPSPDGFEPSGLASSTLAVSLLGVSSFVASPFAGSSLPASVLTASDLGGS